eukprot:15333901-Alexandrium_andersonii.AAC.1
MHCFASCNFPRFPAPGAVAAPPGSREFWGCGSPTQSGETTGKCTMQHSAESCRIVQRGATMRCW